MPRPATKRLAKIMSAFAATCASLATEETRIVEALKTCGRHDLARSVTKHIRLVEEHRRKLDEELMKLAG